MSHNPFLITVRAALLTLLISAMHSPCRAGKSVEADSRWAERQIRVDGRSDDWVSVQGAYLSDQNAAFAFCNDSDFLYVLFRTTDPRWTRTIKATGITLYFDAKGGKKKDASICFKVGPTMEQVMAMRENGSVPERNRPRPDGRRAFEMDEAPIPPSLTSSSKERLKDESIPLDGTAGPAAAFDTCQGFFTYEFRVPLSIDKKYVLGVGAKPGQGISVGAVWGEMGEMMSPGDGPEGGIGGPPGGGLGGSGGGMGMPREGEMGGPGGRREGGERLQMPRKQEIWMKVPLASPPMPASAETK